MEDHCHCSGKEGHRLRTRKGKNRLEQYAYVALCLSEKCCDLPSLCLFVSSPLHTLFLFQSPSTLSYFLLSPHLSLLFLLLSPSLYLPLPPPSPFLSTPILFALQTYGYPRLYRRLLEYNRRNITDRSRRRAIQDNVKYFFRIPNMIGRRFSMALWWVNVTCAAS